MKINRNCDSILKPQLALNLMTQSSNSASVAETEMLNLREPSSLPRETELLVVGAGISGIALAARATHLGFTGQRLAILDSNETFAAQWQKRTCAINQKVMRSTYAHHLAPAEDLSLADFARLRSGLLTASEKRQLELARMGERSLPSLKLFMAHCAHVVRAHALYQSAFRTHVSSIIRSGSRWVVRDHEGQEVRAKYVILALGQRASLLEEVGSKDGAMRVIDALECSVNAYLNSARTLCIVGSGNTAAHVILEAVLAGKEVHWVVRNEERYDCFDIPHHFWRDEGYIPFAKLPYSRRLARLNELHHGSAMPEHFWLFRVFKERGLLHVHEGKGLAEVVARNAEGALVRLSDGTEIVADTLVNATGMRLTSLPVVDPPLRLNGDFPILEDTTLEATGHKNLFIASAHAALSIGPAAKNIDGARLSAERIFRAIEAREIGLGEEGFPPSGMPVTRWSRIVPVTCR